MFYDPLKVALLGIAAWVVIWLATPVYVTGFVSGGALGYIALCYGGFAIGVWQARSRAPDASKAVIPHQWNVPFNGAVFKTTVALGLLGMVLRVFDRVVLRGASYGGDAMQVRETLEQASVTPVGAIASVFFCFCFIPLIVLLASDKRTHRIKLTILATLIFALPMIESLLQMSRSTLLVTIGMGFIVLVITRYAGNPANRKLVLASLAGLIALSVFSSLIFSARLEADGRNLDESVFTSVYADFLQPNEQASRALLSPNRFEASVYNAVLPNGMYYISGVYEMSVLWERPDRQYFGSGRIHFYPFYRAVQILLGGDDQKAFDSGEYLYRIGVWQTFFGPVWVDFGWLGPLFLAALGYVAQSLSTGARNRQVRDLPLYAYLLVVILFMPVVNLLANGLSLFGIVSCLLFRMRTAPNPVPVDHAGLNPYVAR